MNLKVIHIVFVGSAVLLALFFGGWCLAQGAGFFALGVGSFVVAAALVVYGFWFWRKITTPEEEWNRRRKLFRTLPVVVGVWLFGSEARGLGLLRLLRRLGRCRRWRWRRRRADARCRPCRRLVLAGCGVRDASRYRPLLPISPAPRASLPNRPSAALVEHS